MKPTTILRLLMAIPALMAVSVSQAQDYPNRAISLVLPYSAGTGIDAATRSMAESMHRHFDQHVIVLNKVGAGGNIGTEAVAKAAPDGYTALVVANTIAINPSLYKNLRYDPLKDLVPVGLMLKGAMVLVAGPAAPDGDLKKIISTSTDYPDKFNYSSAGIGTPQHLAMEMLKSVSKLSARHIPHKGAAEAVVSVASGQIELAFVPIQSAMPLIAGGKLRALAVSSPERQPAMPDVPTIAESIGVPFDVDLWYGMFVPAGTPQPIVDMLAREMKSALTAPDMQSKLGLLGMSVAYSTPEYLTSLTRRDMERWATVIRKANITAD